MPVNTESRIPQSPLYNILLLLKWSDNKSTLHKPLQGEKCSSSFSLVDVLIVLPRVFFFASLCLCTNLQLLPRARTPT